MNSQIHTRRLTTYFIMAASLLLSSCIYEDINKCTEQPKPVDTYSYYPYVPGTPEWVSLGNTNNLFKASQLPMGKLKSISSAGLAQSLLDNPCLGLIGTYSTYFTGRNAVLLRLNVSFELNKRIDGALALVDIYKKKTPACYPSDASSLDQGDYLVHWIILEVIMTQDSLINQLSHSEKVKLTNILLDKYENKIRSGIDFDDSKITNILVMSQLMRLDKYVPYLNELKRNIDLLNFANTGHSYDNFAMQRKIINFASSYAE